MDTNFFRFFQIFLKVKAVLPYSESVFFNILYPADANGFSPYRHSIFFFWLNIFLLLLEILVELREWYFSSSTGNIYFNEVLHSGYWKEIFRLVETFLFSEVFLQVETVTGTSGSQL